MEEKDYLHINDIMNILNIGRNKAYKLVRRNDFPKIKIGRIYLIPRIDFDKFMKRFVYKELKI